MGKVHVYKDCEGGKLGLGVKVTDESATLADLLAAWQPLCDDTDLYKEYAFGKYSACKGCKVNCCKQAYVIPDLISFKMMASYLGVSLWELASTYLDPDKLKINIPRLKTSPCVFLREGMCSIYPVRTLICRFYLCTHILGQTEELIYSITLAGMTATQVYLAKLGLVEMEHEVKGVTDYERHFLSFLDEYRESKMVDTFLVAQDYSGIPLKLFLPPA